MTESKIEHAPQPEAGEVHLDEWIGPELCDQHGVLRAGKVLEWMDVVGALAASRHVRRPAVIAAVDGCELLDAVRVGERITMRARVVHTARRAVGVAVEMTADRRRVLSGYMSFVAIDDHGHAVVVPQLQPQTAEEIALHREGEMRRQFRRELVAGSAVLSHPEALLAAPTAIDRESQVLEMLREVGRRLAGKRFRSPGLRAPQASYIHKIEPVRGDKLNVATRHGTLMRWIESCAVMSASAFVGCPVRPAAVHDLSFLRPVTANVFVHLDAVAAHSDVDTVTVMVTASAENPLTGSTIRNLRGFLTCVPVDREVLVPGVSRADAEEAARYCEVELRLGLRDRIAAIHRTRR
jgi:acyl-CoA hydrolase